MIKKVIKDKYNDLKSWEITKLSGGFYLKQFINNKQFGRGQRVTKKWIEHILEINLNTLFEN